MNLFKYSKKLTTTTTRAIIRQHSSSNASHTNRIMRLVYSKVHPDLFNHFQDAKIINENSLKSLKTLIDDSKLNRYASSKLRENLIFYVKKAARVQVAAAATVSGVKAAVTSQNENELKKVEISSKDKHVEILLNELIDLLELKIDKFEKNAAKVTVASSSGRLNMQYASYDEDDDEFDFEESRPVMVKLKSWLESLDKKEIQLRTERHGKLTSQIKVNTSELTDKLKFKSIFWQSNWSLNNFNSYLLALKTLKLNQTFDFIDLNIILTDNFSGLQKDGFICLNCHQVIQQWLEVLNECKKYEFLIKEIKLMETHLQSCLFNTKLNDSLFNKTRFQIKSAFNYYATLNIILNKFAKQQSTQEDYAKKKTHDFFNLQLVIDDFNSIDLNHAGQFLIGSYIQDYKQVVDFISANKKKSIELYNAHLKSKASIEDMKTKLKTLHKLKEISFDSSLMDENVKACLSRLLTNSSTYFGDGSNYDIIIGNSYQMNENGSITIPWNWVD